LQPAPSSPISCPMANISKLKQVQEKRRVLADRIANTRAMLERLEAEERDLAIAERVLASLDSENEFVADVEQATKDELAAAESTAKPAGIPTMPEMIVEALRDAKSRGQKGLEPKEITAFIADRWWPAVTINAVGPIAWRMYTKDKLTKRNSRYSLPKAVEETGEANAAA
jgi:hypothetical protein